MVSKNGIDGRRVGTARAATRRLRPRSDRANVQGVFFCTVDLDVDLIVPQYRFLDDLNTPCRQLGLIHMLDGPSSPEIVAIGTSEVRF